MNKERDIIDFSNSKYFRDWFQLNAGNREAETLDGMKVRVNDSEKLQRFFTSPNKPALITLSGSSESGKSHMGQKFVKEGRGHRIKIIHAADLYVTEKFPTNKPTNLLGWLNSLVSDEERLQFIEHASKQLKDVLSASEINVGVIETIKHPWIIEALEKREEFRTLSLFIDAPLSSRVMRESYKTGRPTDEIIGEIQKKDQEKQSMGNDLIAEKATLYINNSGSMFSYNNLLTALSEVTLGPTKPNASVTIEYLKKD